MDITIYWNKTPDIYLGKEFEQIDKFENVVLKDGCSVSDPVFIVSGYDIDNIASFNYVHWNKMHRYYYVKELVILTGKRFEIHCHVDVLQSFMNDIKEMKPRVSRSQEKSKRSSDLIDNEYLVKPNKKMRSTNMSANWKMDKSGNARNVCLITSGYADTQTT